MTSTIGIIGIILAIAFMIYGAYKGLGALPLSLISALIIVITSGMPIWQSFAQLYINGYASAYVSYFLIFSFSALYAKVMQEADCATSIAYKLIDWFGTKYVVIISIAIIAILTYGGVSLFVVVFAAGPIMFSLFREANLPRHLMIGCIYAGACTFTMTCLPGSPQLTNVIPSQFLGTSLTAAPLLGIICGIVMCALTVLYMQLATKKAVAAGEGWTEPDNFDAEKFAVKDRSELPEAWRAFLPMILLVLFIIIGGRFISDTALLAVLAMIIGTVVCYVLNFDRLKKKSLKEMVTAGLEDGIPAISGLAAVIGFGSVVQGSAAFNNIVNWVMDVNLSPYIKGIFATAVLAGITGSSSGGVRLMLNSMGEYLIDTGANMGVMHRLISIAAGSLDSLPHSSCIFLMFNYLGLNHKVAYRHVLWTSVIIPAAITIVATAICTLAGL